MDLGDVFTYDGLKSIEKIAELTALANLWVDFDDQRKDGKITAEDQVKMFSGVMFPTVVGVMKTLLTSPHIYDLSVDIEDERRELGQRVLKSDLQ